MPNLPKSVTVSSYSVTTFGLFLLLGFIIGLFIVWKEGKNDGFEEEKLFDIVVVSALFAALGSKYHVLYGLLGFLVPVFGFTRLWKWSIYRIFDILALGLSLFSAIAVLGLVALQFRFELLFVFSLYIFLFAFLTSFRTRKLKSGYVFSIYLLVSVAVGLIFFREPPYLIFYVLLATLSTVVFLLRSIKEQNNELKITQRLIRIFKKTS